MNFARILGDLLRGHGGAARRAGLGLTLFLAPTAALAQVPGAPPLPEPNRSDPSATPPPTAAPEPPVAPVQAPSAGNEPKSPEARRQDEDEQRDAKSNKDARAREEKKDETKDKAKRRDLEIEGRVFALAELSHRHEQVVSSSGGLEERDRDALDLSLQSARLAVSYRSPLRWLSVEVELELAGKVRARDAFIEAGRGLFVRAGQFKLPSAALELASPWELPLVRGGLVHDLFSDWLDMAGRRPGVALGYRRKDGLKPRFALGVFQGTTLKSVAPGSRDVELIDHASLKAQTLAARAEFSPLGVALGVWCAERVGSIEEGQFEHFATLGLDATVERRLQHGAVRVWVDVSGGESLYAHTEKPGTDPYPFFVATRALIAHRFGGTETGALYLEPFGFFALMDPDVEVVSDFVTEAAVGVGLGFWDRARLSLQAETTSAQRNFPAGFLDGQTPEHRSLLLQAGARF